MTRSGRDLLERALKLPAEERVRLAHEILESVDEGRRRPVKLSRVWREEIERRLAEEPAPGSRWSSGEEIVARLRAELGKKRGRKKRRES